MTLNVQGIADPDKRALLFRFLRDHPAHVICLQEVHAPDDTDFWSVHWGGPASWNYHTAILFSPSLGKPTFDVTHEGRVLSSTFRFQGQVYKIANIYAHADRSARGRLFDQLSASADLFSSYDFLVGDWNSYPDPIRDRVSTSPPHLYQTWPHLLPVLAPFTDAAFAGAASPYHTFHKINRNGIAMHSRLDHVFMNVRHTSFVPSTVLHHFPRSDHDAVHVTLTSPSFSRPLLWRYNTSLLSSPDLRASTITRLLPYRSPTLWDATKDITRSHAQDFAVVSARRRQSDRCRLERQLSSAFRRAARDVTDSQAATDVLDLRSQLDECLVQETSRATLRARVRWLEEGETCSAYFFSRFRSRSSSPTLSLLRDSDGSSFSSDSARRSHIWQYFTSLCAAPPFYPPDCHSFLASITLPTLSPAQSSSLLTPVTADELMSTIKALPPRRAPGPDGIPYEWYQTFADSLVPILLPLFNSILSGGPAPPSWSRTLVSLIPKPGRDLSSIANWRPITLANCDVKIFSRLLASRLASVLPDLVSPHQAGFVKHRNAADVAMAVRNVLGYAADEAAASPVDGALVFLDQEKAYDRISHPYLSAVLTKFGFPPLVQHAFSVTYTDTSAFFLDDGHPVGPVSVACGVRQGDPLAPLLFNLAFEPLLVALRTRLQGIRLPWGVFITGAYADDATIGIALSDGRVLLFTLNEYCRASNSRINFTKSKYMPLSSTVHSLPQWAADLGLQFHDPQNPIRVLGYDLVLSPEGVQENWDALLSSLESVSQDILSRRLTLQGRSLCVTSMLFSRLWYKFRLSTPETVAELNKFTRLGWKTVWNDHPGIAPSMEIGRCSRQSGGVRFLSPVAQASALQAQWISTFLNRETIWSDAFRYVLRRLPGGSLPLATTMRLNTIRRAPLRWQPILKAWAKLRPHWNPDLTVWSPSQALSFIPSGTHSARNLYGVPLVHLLVADPSNQHPVLMSDAAAQVRFQREAPARICTVLKRIRDTPSSLEAQLVHFLCSLPFPLPLPGPAPPFAHLLVADTPVSDLTTAKARRFLDGLDHISSALDWNDRAISRLGVPPSDIWQRVWRSPLLPRHRETWYKLLQYALPLGHRIFHFAPEELLCHACPTVQTLRHFIYDCPLAQQVWSDFRSFFRLPQPVTLQQALYSWPSGGSRFLGGGFGYRLQAGHAVALHTLWTAHCQAVYDDIPSSRPAISNRFKFFLRRHFYTLQHSRFSSRLGPLPLPLP